MLNNSNGEYKNDGFFNSEIAKTYKKNKLQLFRPLKYRDNSTFYLKF